MTTKCTWVHWPSVPRRQCHPQPRSTDISLGDSPCHERGKREAELPSSDANPERLALVQSSACPHFGNIKSKTKCLLALYIFNIACASSAPDPDGHHSATGNSTVMCHPSLLDRAGEGPTASQWCAQEFRVAVSSYLLWLSMHSECQVLFQITVANSAPLAAPVTTMCLVASVERHTSREALLKTFILNNKVDEVFRATVVLKYYKCVLKI